VINIEEKIPVLNVLIFFRFLIAVVYSIYSLTLSSNSSLVPVEYSQVDVLSTTTKIESLIHRVAI
jgi:hypothetical protein